MATLHTPDNTTPVDPSQEDEALYAAVLKDEREYRETQARLENGSTAEVLQIQGNVNKTLSEQGIDNKSVNTREVQMGTEPLSDAYMDVLETASNTGEVQMGTKPLSDAYMAKLNNIA